MHGQPRASNDLAMVLMTHEPRLVREVFVAAEQIRAGGFATTVLQLEAAISDRELLARLNDVGAGATAIGVTDETLERSVGASQAVLRERPGPVVLFGGLFATESARRKVPQDAATGLVVGPAGPTLVELLRVLPDGGRPIAGLDRLDGDLRPRAPRGVLERRPFPRFQEANLVQLRRAGLPMRSSYGCPRRCLFCAEQPREGVYRARTANDVVDEMIYHREHNDVRRFHFCDLVINGDLRLVESVCDLLLEQSHRDMLWWGRALVDPCMPAALYRKMRLAGCIALEFKIPSASDRILALMRTGFAADDASSALERASAAGINTKVSVVVGLPGEAELEFGETCAWLDKNRFSVSQVGDVVPCTLEEGSLLLRDHSAYGIGLPAEDGTNEWHDGGFNTRSFRLKRARELRVYIEDQLHLPIVGRAPEIPWGEELRGRIGPRLAASAELSTVRSGRYRREQLDLAGVAQQGGALAGPSHLEIDLTNNCNQHCAGCWVHSYLMGEERLTGAKRRATLEYEHLERLIRGARKLGARSIQLSGAGEPFMHPRIEDVLALIKHEGFEVNLITNFTLVDEDRARKLVDLGVDAITVSLWAGTTPTYLKTHPTAREGLFEQIVRVVSHLTWYRRRTGARFPRVKIYNVISNLNCHEINEMIDVAAEMGADLIEFTPIDIIAGKTDTLALSEEDTQRILDQLMNLRRRTDYLQRTAEEVEEGRLPGLEEQGEYARFLQRHRLAGDFRFCLDDIRRWETYCRRGIHCSRVYEEIHRDSAIFFGYPPEECHGCMAFVDCGIDPITLTVRAPYVSLQGFGSFWRRIHGTSGSGRDAKVVDRVPCAIGYTYARVQATGHVIPCCKAADFPLGNILERSFEEIWFSAPYDEFRRKALSSPKSDPYFAPMECYKVCDNLGHNMATHEALSGLSPEAREVLLKPEE